MNNLVHPDTEKNSKQDQDFPVAPHSIESRRRVSVGGDKRTIDTLTSGRQHTSLTNLVEPKYGPGRCTSENALIALQAKFGIGFQNSATTSRVVISKSDNLLNDNCIENAIDSSSERARLHSPKVLSHESTVVLSAPSYGLTTETQNLLSPEPPSSLTSHSSSRRTPTIEEEPDEFQKLI